MVNLLEQTLEILVKNGKSSLDVQFVRFDDYYCSWDEFASVASFEYDDGYGGAEIDVGMKVVGNDWWLERGEYDGSEWWEFKTLPEKPGQHRVPTKRDDLTDRY